MTTEELERIALAAHQVEAWLRCNIGNETAEYPCRLQVDNQESADEITERLTELHAALKPYRAQSRSLSS